MDSAVAARRLHVGGLPEDVREDELAARFRSFGSVRGVELIPVNAPGGKGNRGFGYVDLETSDAELARCIKTYKGTRWRGKTLTIETANPHYLERLRAEWAAAQEAATAAAAPLASALSGMLAAASPVEGAVEPFFFCFL